MGKYFTIQELCKSDVAKRHNIYNIPDKAQTENLNKLIAVLDSLREEWGKPIYVTSGFRCPDLNKAVGGVNTSAHLTGNAADLVSYPYQDFKKWINSAIDKYNYDQLITEYNSNTEWIHLGLYNNKGEQRKQKFIITNGV